MSLDYLKNLKKQSSQFINDVSNTIKQNTQKIQSIDFTSIIQTITSALNQGLYGAIIGLAIIPCVLLILCLLGFGSIGIALGSLAACRQASIGLVPAKSCFSLCQSIAMNSLTYYLIPIFGFIGFLIGIIYGIVNYQ